MGVSRGHCGPPEEGHLPDRRWDRVSHGHCGPPEEGHLSDRRWDRVSRGHCGPPEEGHLPDVDDVLAADPHPQVAPGDERGIVWGRSIWRRSWEDSHLVPQGLPGPASYLPGLMLYMPRRCSVLQQGLARLALQHRHARHDVVAECRLPFGWVSHKGGNPDRDGQVRICSPTHSEEEAEVKKE